mmetsp:Transcript_5344/g.9245  ORF Transcript_5344/g.9245 Transcript_5344/m.9245 type:complete len:436 (-) Transcript_5344:2013-3320(-)
MRQHFGTLFLRQREALCPVAIARVHVQRTVHITGASDEFIPISFVDQLRFVPVFHQADHVRGHLLRQHPCLVPNLPCDVAIHRFPRCIDALVQLRGRLVALDQLQAFGHDGHGLVVTFLRVLHREPHTILPDLLQAIRICRGRLRDREVGVNGPGIVARLLVDLGRVQNLVQTLWSSWCTTSFAVGVDDISQHMRAMLLADPNSLGHVALGGIRLHGQFGLASLDEEVLSCLHVVLIHQILGVMHHDIVHALRLVGLCHPHGRHPITLVDVHINGFFRLFRLDELLLSQLELLIIFQGQGLFEVDVRQFVLRREVGQFEGVLEVAMLHRIVDGNFNETVLRQQLRTRLGTVLFERGVGLRQDNLLKGLLAAVHLGHSLGILPLLQLSIHRHGAGPHLRLNVVMLGLFQVALHLVLLRDVLVGIVQEFLAILGHQA